MSSSNTEKYMWEINFKIILYSLIISTEFYPSQHGFFEGKSADQHFKTCFPKLNRYTRKLLYLPTVYQLPLKMSSTICLWLSANQELKDLDLEVPYTNRVSSFLWVRVARPNWPSNEIQWYNKDWPQGACLGTFLWRVLWIAFFVNSEKELFGSGCPWCGADYH